jgi:hypothetical protein
MAIERKKELIGRTLRVDLPKLGFLGIAAKVDTGAYYCSLHCSEVELYEIDGKKKLCFKLLDSSHPEYKDKQIQFKKFETKSIKNSSGIAEDRFVIRTTLRINNRRIRTYVTLTDRGSMKFPMLIGRKLLKNKFVVDVSIK